MTQYFIYEYENNKDNVLTKTTESNINNLINSFDREQVFVDSYTRLDYAQLNNIESIQSLFRLNKIVHCFHQDSERDIFIVD